MSGKNEQIEITVDRKEVEQLLKGLRKTMQQAIAFENLGMMEFCGDQHNPDWRWDFKELKRCYPTTQSLYNFYQHGKRSHE